MNKQIIIISTLAIIAIGMVGWFGYTRFFQGEKSRPSPASYQGKIVIGTETWPGYLPLYVARDKGYFREAGLDVEIKRYIALGELSKDYVAGKIQGRANLTLDAINESLNGLDHKVILAIDYSNGSDAIVARQGIKNIPDLKGRRVAYEVGTLEEVFVAWALGENNLSLSDIVPVPGNPEESIKN